MAPPMAPPMAPTKSSSGLKILVALLVILFVGGIAVVGGMIYVAHRVKEAVVEKAKDLGVELPASTAHTSSATPARIPKPCDVLSNQEVSSLIGQPIEHSEPMDQGCLFIGPAGLAAKLAQENAAGQVKQAEGPGGKVNPGEMATAMEQVMTTSGAAQGITGSGGEAPLLMLTLNPDGKSAVAAMSIANGIFGGIAQAASGGKASMGFDEVPGLGDRAIRTPKLGLTVLKGDLAIGVIPGPLPDANPKCISVARAVLAKL
jgi:hypothetical protein